VLEVEPPERTERVGVERPSRLFVYFAASGLDHRFTGFATAPGPGVPSVHARAQDDATTDGDETANRDDEIVGQLGGARVRTARSGSVPFRHTV
jgi:hypothetical protein